jgi:peptidoglycan/LPS O-acetylase OafA/YrhL
MGRRRTALSLLLAFAACTTVAIVVSGIRSGTDQGIAPWMFQVIGYLCAIAAGVLLLARSVDGSDGQERRIGAVVIGAIVTLILVDALAEEGPNIGAGFARLVLLVLVTGAAVRLGLDSSSRRS